MGSRILSRSFNVERWNSGEDEEEIPAANTSHGSGMDVDSPEGNENVDEPHHAETEGEEEEEEDDDEEEDSSDVAMVPMADLLNARYGSENVCGHHILHLCSFNSAKFLSGKVVLWETSIKNGFYQAYQSRRTNRKKTCIGYHCGTDRSNSGTLTEISLTQNFFDDMGMWICCPFRKEGKGTPGM